MAPDLTTLTAYYDLAIGPVSFDVLHFLTQARMAQKDKGCDKLHVVIVPDAHGIYGMFRDKTALYDGAEMHWRLWNIIIPACQLSGASVALATDWNQAMRLCDKNPWPDDWDCQSLANAHHHARPIVEAARAGYEIPKLKASEHARRSVRQYLDSKSGGKPVVVLTGRNTYDPERNTDVTLMRDLIRELTALGYFVLPVSDTADALAGGGYAELNLDLRMALYESVTTNVHGNSGPAWLCAYSDAPYVQFNAAAPREIWAKHWLKYKGLAIGDQLPWARSDQRLVYDKPSLAELLFTMHTQTQAA